MATRIAALDIGLKRIGVAISLDGDIVLPQNAIIRRNRNQAADEISAFLREWGIEILVVGLPKGGSSEEEMGRRIRHFVSLIDMPQSIEVKYQDEYGTSHEAKEQMRGDIRQKKDGKIDSIAAKIILERWLSI